MIRPAHIIWIPQHLHRAMITLHSLHTLRHVHYHLEPRDMLVLTRIPVTTPVTRSGHWPVCGCDLPRVRVTTERRGPGPAHVLTPWHDTGASPSSPPATHPWSGGGYHNLRSVPSLLIVLLDFVLKVLKLCLFFDELFRVRMSEEHNTSQSQNINHHFSSH